MKKCPVTGLFHSSLFWKVIIMGTAVWFWNILMIVIGILIVRNPADSTVTDVYYLSCAHWGSRANLYDLRETMNYLPHFAIVFSVFRLLPLAAGEILWRLCSVAVFATGLGRFVKRIFPGRAIPFFLFATVLAMPLSAAATRNGQSNVILAGLMLHAAASLSSGGFRPAAWLIALALVAKPIAIVLVLLAPVVYRPLRVPMLAALAVLAVFPFLFAKPDYVLSQYHGFLAELRICSVVPEYDYADITGFLWPLHIQLPHAVSLSVRASAGLLTLGLWWLGARRLREPLRAFWLYTLAAGYLMLFNPMNESNSYVILAPALAIWALFFLRLPDRRWMGWTFAFMAFSMGILPNIVRPWFRNKFALCYHPVMTIFFLAMLIVWLWREKEMPPSASPEAAGQTRSPAGSKAPLVS